ncbi:MAG: hypothetical protein ACE5EX_10230, partial [Phycisphaerae bacterium]
MANNTGSVTESSGVDTELAEGLVTIKYVGKLAKGIHPDVMLVGHGSHHTCEVGTAARLVAGEHAEFEPLSAEDKSRIDAFIRGGKAGPPMKGTAKTEDNTAASPPFRKVRRGGLESDVLHHTEGRIASGLTRPSTRFRIPFDRHSKR